MKKTSPPYEHQRIETKWQEAWKSVRLDVIDLARSNRPFYNLMMFPYPSAEGLHVGNMYAFSGSDIYGRFKRMQGHDVFEPIGLDGFGIHSENYALKIGRHPMDHAAVTQKNFYTQLQKTGSMYDWSRTLETYDPDYYRWTQWLFVQMFKHGLAYRGKAEVNWCPSCKTVLADEQVVAKKATIPRSETTRDLHTASGETADIEGSVSVCERCGNIVEKKLLEQWFFRITAYAEKLLENLTSLDWSPKVKIAQKNWIGKKEGILIYYKVVDAENKAIGQVACFTTRPDTNFGATFVVLAPEHEFISQCIRVIKSKQVDLVRKYVQEAAGKSEKERILQGRTKTGVFTGLYCINDLNGYKMPLYISDFVVASVGSGAVVGVPGHDKRDYEFASAFSLPIKRVVVASDGKKGPITRISEVQEKEGTMVNSEFLDGLSILAAKEKIMDHLETKGWGKRTVSYHLRDWLISRQRYWGPPIPMIFCKKCAHSGASWYSTDEATSLMGKPIQWNSAGWYPVPEKDLPVVLPRIDDYTPSSDGVPPLAKHKEFYETTCPGCGGKAVRETAVSDTFLDSSWYFLRYPSIKNGSHVRGDENFLDPLLAGQSMIGRKGDHQVDNKTDTQGAELGKRSSKILLPFTARNNSNESFPWDPEITKKWLPVHMYTGGAEHSVLHLMYSRFITMAMKDFGYLTFEEPFAKFYAHGLVIKDGAKMSKSKGNVVNPDEYIARYGADALRLYLMFMGPFDQGGDFRDSAMEGTFRWVGRVWRLAQKTIAKPSITVTKDIQSSLQKLIKKVTEDIERRHYNTAIAAMMEFTNFVGDMDSALDISSLKILVLLLAPFAPHLTEEVWQQVHQNSSTKFERNYSVHSQSWPAVDESLIASETVELIIQVNGKLRDVFQVANVDAAKQSVVESLALKSPKVRAFVTGKPKKVVFVPNRLINFVV